MKIKNIFLMTLLYLGHVLVTIDCLAASCGCLPKYDKQHIYDAILQGNAEKLESVLQKRCLVDNQEEDKQLILQSLASDGCKSPLDFEIVDGQNPLHLAVLLQPFQLDVFQTLLKYADRKVLNFRDIYGDTPLFKAIFMHCHDAIDELLRCGKDLDPNSRDNNWQTAAHYAILTDNQLLLERLFELGALGYEKDLSHKRALLHYAVIYQRHKVLEYLLQLKYENTPACTNYKLYINAVDSQGMTPLDYALEHRDTYAIELLYRYRKETIDPDAGKGWGKKHVQKIVRDNTLSDTVITVEGTCVFNTPRANNQSMEEDTT